MVVGLYLDLYTNLFVDKGILGIAWQRKEAFAATACNNSRSMGLP